MECRHILRRRGTVGFWEVGRGVVVIDCAVEHFVFAADFYAVYDEAEEEALGVEVGGGEGLGVIDGDVGEHVWGDCGNGFDGGGFEIGELAFEIGFVHLQFFETFGGGFGLLTKFFEDIHHVGNFLSDGSKPGLEVEAFFCLFDQLLGGIRLQLFVGGEEIFWLEDDACNGIPDGVLDRLAWDAALGAVAFSIGAGAEVAVVGLAAFLRRGTTEERRATMSAATDAAEKEAGFGTARMIH